MKFLPPSYSITIENCISKNIKSFAMKVPSFQGIFRTSLKQRTNKNQLFQGTFFIFPQLFQGTFSIFLQLFQGTFFLLLQRQTISTRNDRRRLISCTLVCSLINSLGMISEPHILHLLFYKQKEPPRIKPS